MVAEMVRQVWCLAKRQMQKNEKQGEDNDKEGKRVKKQNEKKKPEENVRKWSFYNLGASKYQEICDIYDVQERSTTNFEAPKL